MEHTGTRLKQIRKHLGQTQAQLAEYLGCGKANIAMKENGKCAVTERDKSLLVKSLNVNIEFFETGHGPILNPIPPGKAGHSGGGQIPLFDLTKAHDLKSTLNSPSLKPEGFISIPHLPDCDGAAYFVGDGMHPILRSGDMVLYQITDTTLIIWGDMYLISVSHGGREYITVCYLDRAKDPRKAVMRGAGGDRSETEIDISRINAIALVKATIRLNSVK